MIHIMIKTLITFSSWENKKVVFIYNNNTIIIPFQETL